MSLGQQITDKLFNQCVNLVSTEANQDKLKTNIVDPLVSYFKQRLRFFYVIITILLIMILVTNVFLIVQFFNLRSLFIKHMSFTASLVQKNII